MYVYFYSSTTAHLADAVWCQREAELHDDPLGCEEGEVGVDVVVGGHGVEDEVQAAARRRHALLAGAHHEVVRPDLHGSGLLAGRGGDGRHLVAHRLGQLDPELAQASDTHDTNPLASIQSLDGQK